jgi:hypothetical protein
MPELLSSGGQTRTDGLWVMSPTSYQLLHPAMYLLVCTFVFKNFASQNIFALAAANIVDTFRLS